jgi:hypothetical protein
MRTAPWLLLCHRKSLKYVEARVWHNTNETLLKERMINGIMVLVLAIVVWRYSGRLRSAADLFRPTDALGRGDAGCGQSSVPRSSGVRGSALGHSQRTLPSGPQRRDVVACPIGFYANFLAKVRGKRRTG